MNILSRTITGVVMIVAGFILIVVSYWARYITLIYGIPILILGFFILFNKKEDKIEQIKTRHRMKGGRKH